MPPAPADNASSSDESDAGSTDAASVVSKIPVHPDQERLPNTTAPHLMDMHARNLANNTIWSCAGGYTKVELLGFSIYGRVLWNRLYDIAKAQLIKLRSVAAWPKPPSSAAHAPWPENKVASSFTVGEVDAMNENAAREWAILADAETFRLQGLHVACENLCRPSVSFSLLGTTHSATATAPGLKISNV